MALAQVQQADGRIKPRLVVVLQEMPPYRDLLVCAVSSQLRHECQGFDDVIGPKDDYFAGSGLKVSAVLGGLGAISQVRLERLRGRLAAHIEGGSSV